MVLGGATWRMQPSARSKRSRLDTGNWSNVQLDPSQTNKTSSASFAGLDETSLPDFGLVSALLDLVVHFAIYLDKQPNEWRLHIMSA